MIARQIIRRVLFTCGLESERIREWAAQGADILAYFNDDGDATGAQLVQEDVHVALLTGAGQHEPVTTFLDGYEQVAGTGQRRHLLEQRVDLLALLLPGLIARPAL